MLQKFSYSLDTVVSKIVFSINEGTSYIVKTIQGFSGVRFRIKEQVLFAKRLAFLNETGVSMVDSLNIIINQTKSLKKQRIFLSVRDDVVSGKTLATALKKYPKIFGEFTINIINVGENSGTLAQNLNYLADELNKKHKLQRKIKGALMYPLFITATTFGVTGLLIAYIFPKIMPIFISLNIKLPLLTRVLLQVSVYLQHYGVVTTVLFIIFIILFLLSRKSIKKLQIITDSLILRLPIIGHISRSYNCANFCRTMSLNLKSGVNLVQSLTITASVMGNSIYKNACLEFITYINRGENISTGMKKYSPIFPSMLMQIIFIGETTGKLSESLTYLSEQYEQEVDESTKNLSESIEPILLLTMGVLVGLIAISIITPIYEITKYLGNSR